MDKESQSTLACLIRDQKIAALGTMRKGAPMVSMVQYAQSGDFSDLYIHISRLAMHTQNILKHPQTSLLIVDSGQPADDIQAIARVSISATAEVLAPAGDQYAAAKKLYLAKHPAGVLHFQLGDFSLYRLHLQSGRYIAGFGKIFNISPEDLVRAAALPG